MVLLNDAEGRGGTFSPPLSGKSLTSCPLYEQQGEQWDGTPQLQKKMLKNHAEQKQMADDGTHLSEGQFGPPGAF